MANPPRSPLRIGLNTFFAVLFGTLGIFVAFLLLILLIGVIKSSPGQLDRNFNLEVLPDASGTRKALGSSGATILVIDIDGTIGLDRLTSQKIEQLLVESREGDLKDRVKGIILRIRSGGGTAIDSEAIYQALMEYKERYKTPVYTFIDGMANSGGYMIAIAGDKLYATQSSIVGSVGVLLPTIFNFSQLLETYHVQTANLTAGKDKDALNPTRPWKPEEKALIQDIIDDSYDLFVSMVSVRREQLTEDKLRNQLGARVFIAQKALDLGYIDGICKTMSDPIRDLANELHLSEGSYHVVMLSGKSTLAEWIQSSKPLEALLFPSEWRLNFSGKPLLYNHGFVYN